MRAGREEIDGECGGDGGKGEEEMVELEAEEEEWIGK